MTHSTHTSVFIVVLLAFSLTGCMGIYEGGFECPAGIGAKCKSISEVNDLLNKGEIPLLGINESGCSCYLDNANPPKTSENLQIWWFPL